LVDLHHNSIRYFLGLFGREGLVAQLDGLEVFGGSELDVLLDEA